jgi:hypothetical protein
MDNVILMPTRDKITITWKLLSPVIDKAMIKLRDCECDLVLLRFFQGQSVEDMSRSLEIEMAIVERRIACALTKLCLSLLDQGIELKPSELADMLITNAVLPAPEAMVSSIIVAVSKCDMMT